LVKHTIEYTQLYSPIKQITGSRVAWEVSGFKTGPGRPRTKWRITGLVKDGNHLWGSRGDSSNRSEWRRNPLGCGL